jgi:hypothetical protein
MVLDLNANYLYSRMPAAILGEKPLSRLFTGTRRRGDHLLVFGSKAFVPKQQCIEKAKASNKTSTSSINQESKSIPIESTSRDSLKVLKPDESFNYTHSES